MGTDEVPARAAMGGRRLALIVILAVGAVGGWALAVSERGVVLDRMESADPILLGVENEVTIELRNRNLWRSCDVRAVGSSCGCLTVIDAPSRMGARHTASVSLIAAPSPLLPSRREVVDVELGDGEILRIPLAVEPLAPFDGWPTHAVVNRAGSELVVDLAPEYAGVITSAYTVMGEVIRQPVSIEKTSLRMLVVDDSLMPRELVVAFGPGSPNWSGPLVVVNPEVEDFQ